MGGGMSSSHIYAEAKKLQKSDIEIVKLMMPVYYTLTPTNANDITIASGTWDMVLKDTSPQFIENKSKPIILALAEAEAEADEHGKLEVVPASCIMWFYDTFYKRLFDVHPTCKPMFHGGIKKQGKFLVRLLSLALSELNDPAKFDATLTALAEQHCIRGIKAIEYGVVGEVLFYTLHTVLGSEVYNKNAHISWTKIFSRMLKVMVPVAIAYEMNHGRADSVEL